MLVSTIVCTYRMSFLVFLRQGFTLQLRLPLNTLPYLAQAGLKLSNPPASLFQVLDYRCVITLCCPTKSFRLFCFAEDYIIFHVLWQTYTNLKVSF